MSVREIEPHSFSTLRCGCYAVGSVETSVCSLVGASNMSVFSY
jgi:hypothetical protein